MAGRAGRERTGGLLAVALSSLWALAAACVLAFGILVVADGRKDQSFGGFGDFATVFGGGIAIAGAGVLAAAVAGIVLGIKARRGSRGAAIALGVLFIVFGLVSGMFFVSAISESDGVVVGSAVAIGLNTAACLAIAIMALVQRD